MKNKIPQYRNKQATQALNKILRDRQGNIIGMTEDSSNFLSSHFGTVRDPQPGSCYSFPARTTETTQEWIEYPNTQFIAPKHLKISFTVRFDAINVSYSNTIFSFRQRSDRYGGIRFDRGRLSNNIRFIFYNNTSASVWYSIFEPLQDTWYTFIFDSKEQVTNTWVKLTVKNPITGEILFVTESTMNNVPQWKDDGILPKNYIGTYINGTSMVNNLCGDIYDVNVFDVEQEKYVFRALCDESKGDVSYDSSGLGNHGSFVNMITDTTNPNCVHQIQNIKSFKNEQGWGIKWWINVKGENYFNNNWPPLYTHQLSKWGLGPISNSAFATPCVLFLSQGLEAGSVWGVDNTPIEINGYQVLQQNPEGVYLSNGSGLMRYSTTENLQIKDYIFDIETRGGGYFTFVGRNKRTVGLWMNFSNYITSLVNDGKIIGNATSTVYDWYVNVALATEKAELDSYIPVDKDGSVYTFDYLYNFMISSSHTGNAVSNWTNECFGYTHPNQTKSFIIYEDNIVNNFDHIFPNHYQGLSLTGHINSFYLTYYGDDTIGEYGVLHNVKFSELGTDVYIPKMYSSNKNVDIFNNELEYMGQVPSQARFSQSKCFDGISSSDESHIDCGTEVINPSTATSSFRYGCTIIRTGNATNSGGIMGVNVASGIESRYGLHMDSSNRLMIIYFYTKHLLSTFFIEQDKKYDLVVEHSMSRNKTYVYVNDKLEIIIDKVISFTELTTNFRIGSYTSSTNTPAYFFPGKIFNAWLEVDGVMKHHWPLCEPVNDIANHYFHDTIGGKHGQLMNGTVKNIGEQDDYHYLQEGFNFGKIGINRLSYTDNLIDYWTFNNIEIVETGLPDPLGGNKAIRIRSIIPDGELRSLAYSLTRPHPDYWSPRGNYTISTYVKSVQENIDNSFYLHIRNSTISSEFLATTKWNRFSFYGNHNVDIYSGNGFRFDKSFDLIIFGIQMELDDNLSNYESTMFIGPYDSYFSKNKLSSNDLNNKPLLSIQDDKSFFNTGTLLRSLAIPEVIQSDKGNNFWFDEEENPKDVDIFDLYIRSIESNKHFLR